MNKSPVQALFEEMTGFAKPPHSLKSFTVSEFTKFLRFFVGTQDVKLLTTRDSNVDMNQVVMCGIYDRDDDEDGITAITVFVNYNPAQRTIRIADVDWRQLCIDLLECVGHEIIHQTQYRIRKFDVPQFVFASKAVDSDKLELQEYLANPDEIEAYGYSIAAEIFLTHFPRRLYQKHLAASPIFKSYLDAFGADHIVIHQLLAFAVRYFNNLAGVPHVVNQQ